MFWVYVVAGVLILYVMLDQRRALRAREKDKKIEEDILQGRREYGSNWELEKDG